MKKLFTILYIWLISSLLLAQQPRLMLPIGHTRSVESAVFSPDGKKIATCAWDYKIKIWDAESGSLITDLIGHKYGIQSIAFSPDGKKLVSGSFDRSAIIWDAETGNLIQQLKGHRSGISCVSFSPDGKRIASASWDSTIMIWDAGTGVRLKTLKGHTNYVNSVLFHPKGSRIISAGSDSTLKIWDVLSGELVINRKLPVGNIFHAEYNPDGVRIAIATSESNLYVWDIQIDSLYKKTTCHHSSILHVSFSQDGKKIVTSSMDGTICLLDATDYTILRRIKGHYLGVTSARFRFDGQRLVSSSKDFTVKVWDVSTGKLFKNLTGSTAMGTSVSWRSDGKRIVTSHGNNMARVWDVKTLSLLLNLKSHTQRVTSATFSPDGSLIATSSVDGTAIIWNAESGKPLQTLVGHKGYVMTVDFDQSGERVLTASFDTTAIIWDINNGKPLHVLKGHSDLVNMACFSPDGRTLATASDDRTIMIWDAKTGTRLRTLRGHRGGVNSVSFSPDGQVLASASSDLLVKLWDLSTGDHTSDLAGHNNYVLDLMFTPKGDQIISSSFDNNVKVWDVSTRKLLADLDGHPGGAYATAVSPDGKKVINACLDNIFRCWDLDRKRLDFSFFAVGDSTDYLVFDDRYRFDGTQGAREKLYFSCGMEIVELEQLKDQLWVPNLARRIFSGDSIQAKALTELNICGLMPAVLDKSTRANYFFQILPRRGGLGETVVRVNGIEVRRILPHQMNKVSDAYELSIPKNELSRYFFVDKPNTVSVVSYTADNGISSRGLVVTEEKNATGNTAPPNLYAVMVGVSDYKGEELDLKYAAKDARDIANALQVSVSKMLNVDGKEHVFIYDLTSSEARFQIPEKNNIRRVLEEIGKKALPNDILLIFFAGHGVMEGEKKQFYFLTADASQSTAVSAVREVGISTEELTDWMKPQNIQAQKRILIFDACNSGQAIKDFVKIGEANQGYLAARSDEQAQMMKAIDKLNQRSGLFIFSAAASNQSAYEMGRYSQGLLTYSLLKAIKMQPDILEQDKYLDLSRWFHAAEQTVMDLAKETGARQQPQIVSNTNFNIGVVDDEVRSKIILPQEKPVFSGSSFQNADENIAYDDLELGKMIDAQLRDFISRGTDAPIVYSPGIRIAEAWIMTGRYEVQGAEIKIKINIRQGSNPPKYKFELTGAASDLKGLSLLITQQATSRVLSGR